MKKTKEKMILSYIGLCKSKKTSNITIDEIVKNANVGRSSFYRYFEGFHSIQSQAKEYFFLTLNEFFLGSKEDFYSQKNILCILNYLKDNKSLFKNEFLNLGSNDSIKLCINYVSDKINDHPKTSSEKYLIEARKGTFCFIIDKWISNNCIESSEEIANILYELQRKLH